MEEHRTQLAIPLDFKFFRHPAYIYGLKEDLIVRLELNSAEKVILCNGDPRLHTSFQAFWSSMIPFLWNNMTLP